MWDFWWTQAPLGQILLTIFWCPLSIIISYQMLPCIHSHSSTIKHRVLPKAGARKEEKEKTQTWLIFSILTCKFSPNSSHYFLTPFCTISHTWCPHLTVGFLNNFMSSFPRPTKETHGWCAMLYNQFYRFPCKCSNFRFLPFPLISWYCVGTWVSPTVICLWLVI